MEDEVFPVDSTDHLPPSSLEGQLEGRDGLVALDDEGARADPCPCNMVPQATPATLSIGGRKRIEEPFGWIKTIGGDAAPLPADNTIGPGSASPPSAPRLNRHTADPRLADNRSATRPTGPASTNKKPRPPQALPFSIPLAARCRVEERFGEVEVLGVFHHRHEVLEALHTSGGGACFSPARASCSLVK